MTVHVPELNDVPEATDDAFTVEADGTHVFTKAQLLGNDVAGPPQENGQTLAITSLHYQGDGAVRLTENGDVECGRSPITEYVRSGRKK